jgi:hypothetical protein
VYAIPRAELSGKTANFSNAKARCEGASRGIHVAHSLICVFAWALSGASLKT